jgi:hypothetical protein
MYGNQRGRKKEFRAATFNVRGLNETEEVVANK